MRALLGAASVALMLSFAASVQAAPTPPPIEAYGKLPAMQDVTISPEGDRIALIAAGKDKRYIVVRSLTDGKMLQTIDTNDRKVRGVQWADNDHVFISLSDAVDIGGMEDYKVETGATVMINLKTKKGVTLSDFAGHAFSGAPALTVHEDGRTYGYYGTWRVDLDSGQTVLAYRTLEHTAGFVRTPDAKTVVAREEVYDHGRDWRILKGLDDQSVLLRGTADTDQRGSLLGFGRTADTILIFDPTYGESHGLREISLKDGSTKTLTVNGVDPSPIHDRKTHLLIGFDLGREGGVQFFDPNIQQAWENVKAGFPGEHVHVSSYDDAFDKWIVSVDGPHDSGRYFLVDLQKNKAIQIGSIYPDVKPDQVGAFSWFNYTAADGTRLQGVLTLPPGLTLETARNLPLIMLPHGGPRAHDALHFDWWAQALASRGYAVFQPNFRGSTGYGQKFMRSGFGEWGKKMQTDVSDAIPALAARGIIDPKRVCIGGASYGGYVAAAAVTVQNGIYRCAAADAGVYDLNAMVWWVENREGKQGVGGRYWRLAMGLNSNDDPAGGAISPARQAARADAPLLLTHGRQDTVVPFTQSQEFIDALKANHKTAELVVMKNEDHWLSRGPTRTEMLTAMLDWFEKYNPPGGAAPSQVASAADKH